MKKLFIVLSFFLFSASFGQNLYLISPDDIPGMTITRADTFSGKDISRYVGDRTPLCLEYGIKLLYVCEYAFQGDNVKLEVFVMDDEPSAYGLYSLSITNCNIWNLFSTFSCTNNNQVSASWGQFFIKTLNLNKTGSGQELCQQIVQQIITNNPRDTWYLPPLFQLPQVSPYINSLKYTEGPNGISQGAPVLAPLLQDLKFNSYSVTIMTPNFSGILARIVFQEAGALNDFLINVGLNSTNATTPVMSGSGAYQSCYIMDDYKLVYLNCNSADLNLGNILPEKTNPFW
jgi:hypothetical protein